MTNTSHHAASGEGNTFGRRRDRGFSLIELVIVVTVVFVVSGIGVMIVAPALRHRDVELSARTVSLEMRRARQLSVDSRRQFRVTFTAPNTLLTEQNNSGVWTAIRTTQLSGDLQLYIATAVTTGPDGFATGQAVNFSGASVIYFVPDGSAITAARQVCNGVVYVSRPGEVDSTRAVTLFGATGRLTNWQYAYNGGSWQWQ